MPKTLVVCYSRSGHTRKLGEAIASRCGAEFEAIEDVRARKGPFGYWRSGREAIKKLPAAIRPAAKNPADYELVVLGTPVWASHMSSPMRAYLDAHGREIRKAAFFCTQGGSGAEKVIAEMTELYGHAPVGSLALSAGELKHGPPAAKLDRFVQDLAPG